MTMYELEKEINFFKKYGMEKTMEEAVDMMFELLEEITKLKVKNEKLRDEIKELKETIEELNKN